jgi:alanyl aminopeptidase
MSLRRTLLASALLAAIGIAQAAVPNATDVPTGPLPRNVVPSLVQLQLKVDPQQARFSGSTRIEVAIAEPTSVIGMHGRTL